MMRVQGYKNQLLFSMVSHPNAASLYCFIFYCLQVKLCKPALGYSFAAGTTDGPGAFDFTQGSTNENGLWNLITGTMVVR